jgi:hypothetical protein
MAGQEPYDFLAHPMQIGTEAPKDLSANSLALANQAEQ